ncbi:MAG: hypothetical protein RIC35_08905 [Marinoscillum sp.]
MTKLKTIRNRYEKAAFLIGNGPNLYSDIMPSWTNLLKTAGDGPVEFALEGLTYTEVYDLVELASNNPQGIKTRIIKQLALKKKDDLSVHQNLMNLAITTESPVLTTNFDAAFESSIDARIKHIDSRDFTRYYPWKSYYAHTAIGRPTEGFGIWKVHGDVNYRDSIRLGLADYMGSVERARKLLHHGRNRISRKKHRDYWNGSNTWLDIWFNMPIIIIGFGFGVHETFLRWLLIERKRYYRDFHPGKGIDICYVYVNPPKPDVKNLLQTLGVEFVKIPSYGHLYL